MSPEVRASQAVPLLNHNELKAFKKFRIYACAAVPRLLGFTEQKQEGYVIIPNGASITLVWEKVLGASLRKDKFWKFER